MRTIGESYNIVDRGDNQIGTVSGGQVYGECYKGAIYLHRGRQYEIGDRNPERGQIYAEEVDVAYFTRARTEKDTEILEELRSRPLQGFMARLGRLKVSSQVVGYEKIRVGDQVVLSKHKLESPVEHFETIGFWIELDAHFKADLSRHQHHYMGSIHAIEHAMKSLFPLLALCDRTDVGGICYPQHPQLGKGAIFVYDYHPGGIGLAEKGFAQLDRLLDMTLSMVETCDCLLGCPSCIHFPTCGAGNVPLDKEGAIHLLGRAHGPPGYRAHSDRGRRGRADFCRVGRGGTGRGRTARARPARGRVRPRNPAFGRGSRRLEQGPHDGHVGRRGVGQPCAGLHQVF